MFKIVIFCALFNVFLSTPISSTFDWRSKGAVLPVPTLGACAQPVLINALDAVSAAHQIKTGKLIPLSLQQIYDCGGSLCPCQGSGNASIVYDMVFAEGLSGRIDSEESYPFTGKCDKKCNFKASGAVTVLFGYEGSTQNNSESELTQLIAKGPVVVEVEANLSFQIYSGGILDDPQCKGNLLNHVLLLVGYGTENGVDYWIARNSWGTNWGEKGYIRIVRGKNMCGIGNAFVRPFVYQ